MVVWRHLPAKQTYFGLIIGCPSWWK